MSYSVIWEYFVPEDRRADFEAAYGGTGPWVDLFEEAEGFLGTWLLRDKEQQGRYLSHDRWASRAAYDSFKRSFAERYEELLPPPLRAVAQRTSKVCRQATSGSASPPTSPRAACAP